MDTKSIFVALVALLFMSASCGGSQKQDSNSDTSKGGMEERISPSPFNADSAYQHIATQVAFGPRVPNTPNHKQCGDYLSARLRSYGAEVYEQSMTLTAYDGTALAARNIIASFHPEARQRVLLFAHWDTRPIADHDNDPKRRNLPIDGADDGASGVGVLLEIARLLQAQPLKHLGIDIAFFDAEDYGAPEHADYEGNSDETWALGTQYWTRHPHVSDYRASWGVLLDMVGARGATFYREYFSQEYAGNLVSQIWNTAKRLGHGSFFINEMGGGVTDDHYFVIKNMGIPCVDIINYNPETAKGFGAYWHTHDDNLDNIDKETLRAVGETVWQLLQDNDK